MNDLKRVESHYTRGDLTGAILAGVEKLGKTRSTVTIEDLAPVDEFHVGGRIATRAFLDQLSITKDEQVLDIGCGIGGASRYAAREYGCRVTGVDLTEEYIETGTVIGSWLGEDDRVRLLRGNVLALEFPDETFDRAFMLHVGMNLADKTTLATEVWRILKPGGLFGIYDIMRTGSKTLAFPVPWASHPEESFLASPEEYRQALSAAGFELVHERDRRRFALEFFEEMQARLAKAGGPPPLGLHVLMGESASAKIGNMVSNIAGGSIAPVELIGRKVS